MKETKQDWQDRGKILMVLKISYVVHITLESGNYLNIKFQRDLLTNKSKMKDRNLKCELNWWHKCNWRKYFMCIQTKIWLKIPIVSLRESKIKHIHIFIKASVYKVYVYYMYSIYIHIYLYLLEKGIYSIWIYWNRCTTFINMYINSKGENRQRCTQTYICVCVCVCVSEGRLMWIKNG